MDTDAIFNAILMQESGGRGPNPAQIQPDTWRQYAQPGENINNRNDNLAVMRRIIQDYAVRYSGDPARIATAYFSGPGNVTPSNYPNAFFKDKADRTGKKTSSYVADISGRLGNMEENIPDYLSQSGKMIKTTPVAQPQEEAVPDYLQQFSKSVEEKAPIKKIEPIKELAKGGAYGFTHSLSHLLSTGGQAAQAEMAQPIDVPGSEQTFNILQKNVTGQLEPGAGGFGQLGRNIGGTAPYVLTMPGTAGIIPRLVQSALIGTGATAGERATKGTPLENVGGLIGGVLAPTAVPYLVSKAVQGGGHALAQLTGGFSGVGPTPVIRAFQSGAAGGETAQAFRSSIGGQTDPTQIVNQAERALTNLRIERSQQYQASKAVLAEDTNVLDFKDIDKAMESANKIKTFKGQKLQPETQDIQNQVNSAINDWKSLNPAEYHTPLGMDALKQRIGSIKDNLPYNTPQRKVAEDAYNAIRQTIVKQAPQYSAMMKGYEEASNQIDEIRKTLSLNPKASVDTAFRKLLSTMRNNANTNYGARQTLVKQLEEGGAPTLSASLAGQSMQSWLPHGLARVAPAIELPMAAYSAYQTGGTKALLAMLAAAPLQSPRIVGETAHSLGRLYNKISPALNVTPEPAKMLANLLRRPEQLQKFTNTQIPYRSAIPIQ